MGLAESMLSQIDVSVLWKNLLEGSHDTGYYSNNPTGLTEAYCYSVIICQHGGRLTGPQQFDVDATLRLCP